MRVKVCWKQPLNTTHARTHPHAQSHAHAHSHARTRSHSLTLTQVHRRTGAQTDRHTHTRTRQRPADNSSYFRRASSFALCPPPCASLLSSPDSIYWPFQNRSSRSVFAAGRISAAWRIAARLSVASACADDRQSVNQGTIEVKKVAPTMFPRMTGTMFAVSMSPHPTAAPEKMPNGMKNLVA